MGEASKDALRLNFDRKLKLEFHGVKVTSDAGIYNLIVLLHIIYHSPSWWANHFDKSGLVNVLLCQEHPKGREFWLDMVRWRIESGDPREAFYNDVVMLLN